MKLRMSQDTLSALRPAEKRYWAIDTVEGGLHLEVHPSRKMTWWYRYSRFGKPGKVRLGSYPSMTLKSAREKVRELKTDLDQGDDPAYTQGRTPGQKMTVEQLGVRFTAEYLPTLAESTCVKWTGIIIRHINRLIGGLLVWRVTPSDVAGIRDALSATPPTAKLVVDILSSMMNWAEERGIRAEGKNPCQRRGKRKPREEPDREIYLTEVEYTATMEALRTMPDYGPLEKACLRLIILTGCRKNEIRNAEWAWIFGHSIRIPPGKHKTGRRAGTKVIHLGEEAWDILDALPRDHKLIFPNSVGKGNLDAVDSLWRELRVTLGRPDVHIHDLRHTYASILINRGMSLEQIGTLLGHLSPASTRRYAHLVQAYRERIALEAADMMAAADTTPRKKK